MPLRLQARIAAALREPDCIQIPVEVAEAAQVALDDVIELGLRTQTQKRKLEALETAIHNGFMQDVIGDLNAPWRVAIRRRVRWAHRIGI